MIPEFDERGLLPAGIYDCTLDEIGARFCFSKRRQLLFDGLRQFIVEIWTPPPLVSTLLVDGSFVRRKTDPNDIDLVVDLDPSVDFSDALMLAVRFQMREHVQLKDIYNLDVWVRHAGLPNDLSAFFQYAGDKAAAELHLPRKHPKGILRITP
jgi:predicted nucleotidyltransferase